MGERAHPFLSNSFVGGDYHRIGGANAPETLTAAREHLTELEQTRITNIVCSMTPHPPMLQSLMNWQRVAPRFTWRLSRRRYGDVAVKGAWKLLPKDERDRLTSICQNQRPDGSYTQEMTEQWRPTTAVSSCTVIRTKRSILRLMHSTPRHTKT